MKQIHRLCFCLFFLATALLRAGTVEFRNDDATATEPAAEERFPFEFEAEYSLMGDSEVARGFRHVDDLEEDYALTRFIYTPRIKFGILRLGVGYERFGFGMSEDFEVPRGLQALTGIIGLDTQFSDSILVRFEAQPGLYSGESLDGDDFRIPFILGGTYIYNSDLQFVFGVSVDYDRRYPVFPGGGIRWRLSSQWVLNAVAPTPRLEYEMMKGFILYGGADLKATTFRVDDRFGFERGNLALNHAVMSYSELRTGIGFEWKPAPEVKIGIEGGYMPYRNFDFHRTNVRYHQEEGGLYGSMAVNAAF